MTDSVTLGDYEKEQLKAIEKWKSDKPGLISKTLGSFIHPAASLVQVIVPDVIIRSAMEMCASGARISLGDSQDVLARAGVKSREELAALEMARLDEISSWVQKWAIAYGAAEGMTAGMTGALGLVADIPAIITLSMRTIYKISFCYGFEPGAYYNNEYVMAVMAAAAANDAEEKQAAIEQMQRIVVKDSDPELGVIDEGKDFMSSEAANVGFKTLARQLGINLAKRKALQSIPVIGSGVGATVNAWFLNEVSQAARYSYQDWWLFKRYGL